MSQALHDDSLLQCLAVMARLHQRPMSPESLKAGLPLSDKGMTAGIYIRASRKVGLKTQVRKKKISAIPGLSLPCTLLMRDGSAVVLTGVEESQAIIIEPSSGGKEDINLNELEENYSGYALFSKPEYAPDDRSGNAYKASSAHWLWDTLKIFRPIYAQVLLASFLINLFVLASPLFIMNVYDRVVPNNAMETLWVLATGIGIIFIFDFILKILRSYFLDLAARGSDIIISSRLFDKLMSIRLDKRPASAGVLAGNMREFENVRDFFTAQSLVTLMDVPFILLFLLVIYGVGGSIVIVPLLALPVLLIGNLLIQKPMTEYIAKAYRDASHKAALLVEAIISLETLKMFRAEGYFQRKWETYSTESSQNNIKAYSFSSLTGHFASFTANLVTVGTVIFGVYQIQAGVMSVGALVAVIILAGRVVAPMAQVAGLVSRYRRAYQSYKALDEFMELEEERRADKRYESRPFIRGDIEFKDVTFTYPGAKTPVLKAFSFKMKAGEKIGMVGPIGSGKTTLEKLIMGLYRPDSGQILIDGTDIAQIDPVDLRRNIGVVPQDIQLFYGTARENIALGYPEIEDEQLKKAAAIAGVQSFLRLDESGFDRQISERGESLSGGQRQSIAIARAVALDAPVMMLDEPTSSFDPGSEKQFMQNFQNYAQNKTVIMITHRLPLLSLVDRIIIMSDGKIVADGPKEEILEKLQGGKVNA